MSYAFMYLLVKLDSIRTLFMTLTFGCGMASWLAPLLCAMGADVHGMPIIPGTPTKLFKRFAIATIICASIATLIPNTKEAAAIYIIPQVVNNENIQGITDNSLKALHELSRQWLEELSPAQVLEKEGK